MIRVKSLARFVLHDLGGLRVVNYWNRRRFTILMYHRFPSSVPRVQEVVARQCAYLKRHFRVVPLTEIAKALAAGQELPERTAAVTVDDGYRDFYVNAWPVFASYGIPATVFLVSDFVDRKIWLWWDQLAYALRHTRRPSLEIPMEEAGPPRYFSWESEEQRKQVQSALEAAAIAMEDSRRLRFLDQVFDRLEVPFAPVPPDDDCALDWDEIRRAAEKGIEFGAHTKTHPILSTIRDAGKLRDEIEGSKRRIEQELGRPVLHFCYPNGRWADFNHQAIEVIEKSGFLSACTAESGHNRAGINRYLLRRVGADPLLADYYFKERVAALH